MKPYQFLYRLKLGVVTAIALVCVHAVIIPKGLEACWILVLVSVVGCFVYVFSVKIERILPANKRDPAPGLNRTPAPPLPKSPGLAATASAYDPFDLL